MAPMLFNSFVFWLFFGVVFTLYFRLRHKEQNLLLLVASYYFYGCWDWRFLSLIAVSTFIDYFIGMGVDAAESRRLKKFLVGLSITANLSILGFFKYYGFFIAELEQLLTSIGVPVMMPTFYIILPVGISFYTFQTMSYTIDVYRGDCKACKNFVDFAVYVTFFPQLVAGPIERAKNFLPQVIEPRVVTSEHFKQGLLLIAIGMFRKVVIADNMAPIANAVFATPVDELTGAEILFGIYAFAFQIYGDFSGYSAIARGLAKWMGFDLMVNFRMPYFAISPSDFWQRWHISLSQWLRDYVYIPLGGNRYGTLLTYRNLFLTMLIGGLWHGANWTFIVWGAFHGAILCLYRIFEKSKNPSQETTWPPKFIQMIVMFHLICFSWLLFRADSLTQVIEMTSLLMSDFTISPFAVSVLGMIAFYVTPLLIFEAWMERKKDLLSLLNVHWGVRGMVYLYVVYMIIFFPPPTASEFIYFQF